MINPVGTVVGSAGAARVVFFGILASAQPVARKCKEQVQCKKANPYNKRYVILL